MVLLSSWCLDRATAMESMVLSKLLEFVAVATLVAPLVVTCSGEMKLYKNSICWPVFQLQAPTPRCYRPERLLAATIGSRGLALEASPSRR